MKSTPAIKEIYTGIQHQLSNLIPEKWESIYLYACMLKQLNNLETWEMYFYYIPKGLIKKNPVNVYEIPNKFNVDEEEYLELVDNLCNAIKRLHKVYKNEYNKDWSNMVIAIKDSQFLIEYNNDNILKSKYTSQDRHVIFKHKYLNIPLQSFSKKQRKVIQNFIDNDEYKLIYDRYFEYIPKENMHNRIDFERDNGISEDLYSSQLIVEEDKPSILEIILKKIFKPKLKNNGKKSSPTILEQHIEPRIQILSDK
ncbi:MAG: DUF600 family protein [Clostridia bacterium]|nr:DUF600 family protein [Clostridia bacterium]